MAQQHEDLLKRRLKLEEFAAGALEISPRVFRNKADRTWVALGGDSLMAVFFMGACHEAGIEVDLPEILQAGSVREFIEQLVESQQTEAEQGLDMKSEPVIEEYIDSALLKSLHDCTPEQVQAIGPCSAMQENFVARQSIDPSAYQLRVAARISSANPQFVLTTSVVEQAWRDVVQRHAALRTRIVESVARPGRLEQVILKSIEPEIRVISLTTAEQSIMPFEEYQSAFPHRLTLVQAPDDGLTLGLDISHAIVDAVSIEIITRDLFRALTGTLPAGQQMRCTDFLSVQQPDNSPESLSYWSEYMADTQGSFLSTSSSKATPSGLYTIDHEMPIASDLLESLRDRSSATIVNACQIAWALVLRAYTGAADVCFSYTTSGRQRRVKGLQDAVGNFVNTLPCRVDVGQGQPIAEIVELVHTEYLESIPHQAASLNGNQELKGPSVRELGDSLLTFQRGMAGAELAMVGFKVEVLSWEAPSDYNYTLAISTEEQRLGLRLTTWESVASKDNALNILQLFQDSLDFVLRHTSESCSGFVGLTLKDQERIIARNRDPYTLTQRTVHDQVWDMVQRQPDSSAICAWDGDLTYSELGSYANRLTARLLELGVKLEDKIGLCMDKSRWVPVVMLAILQAGGIVVPLGNQHPPNHIQSIACNANITMLLADQAHASRLKGIFAKTVAVDATYLGECRVFPSTQKWPNVSPENAGWIVHTSGSTGKPKGVVLEHKTLSSTMHEQTARYNMGPWTRAIQFSAHTFDVCVKDIFTTLTFGGCVCIPSEAQRLDDLGSAMKAMGVNFASLTPTVASLLDLQELPLLETIVCTGEALSPAILLPLLEHQKVKVWNGYGPSECSHVSTINGPITSVGEATNIGFSAANRLWVVDALDFTRLCPIGAVGELFIEGAIAREYLNDPERTETAFITDPGFVERLGLVPGRRMYRTGDLVRQSREDGSLTYQGRQDTQVKIRGQRVEIGDIESHISQSLPGNPLVCVDLITSNSSSVLMAAIDMHEFLPANVSSAPVRPCDSSDTLRHSLQELHSKLVDDFPPHMVPTNCVPFVSLPMNASGKLDRRATHELLAALTEEELASFKKSKSIGSSISTATEKALRELWAEALKRPATDIGPDDHFMHLGGDSVVAMRMAAIARRKDISFSVANIVQHPRLADMARVVDSHRATAEKTAQNDPIPFELWADFLSATPEKREKRLATVAEMCNVDPAQVEDVYPTTMLQEGLMAMTNQSRETYVAQHPYILAHAVDMGCFRAAWDKVASALPILRTRIVYSPASGSVQVVIRDTPQWIITTRSLMQFIEEDRAASFAYGTPLHRFAIVKEESTRYFIWTAHHSAYDGPTVVRIFKTLADALQGKPLSSESVTPIPRYIRYLEDQSQEECETYWRGELEGSTFTPFPKLPSPSYQPFADGVLRHHFKMSDKINRVSHQVSPAIILRAAWALVVASHTGGEEAMLAVVLSGRDMPVVGVEDVVAPTITTVPCRVRIDRQKQVTDFLRSVHEQSTRMAPYTQFGLANIRRVISSLSHDFNPGHLFLVQPGGDDMASADEIGLERLTGERGNFEGYSLVVECNLDASGTGTEVEMRFDQHVVPPSQAESLMSQLEHVARQLQTYGSDDDISPTAIQHLDWISTVDKEKLLHWNQPPPDAVQFSLVEHVESQTRKTPDALAVCARDGELTYSQLYAAASRLAQHLVSLDVGPETFVALCMEKSKFAVISVLAILLARGAVVPLGAQYTDARIKTILDDAGISVALADVAQAKRLRSMVSQPIIVNSGLLESLQAEDSDSQLARPNPSSAAWIVYTSGSTGVPKGVVLENQALCTAVLAQGTRFGVSSSTRILQFSSFTFDLSIEEIFATLLFGGCICVPSETDRTDRLAAAMRELAVTFAILTPTVVSLLDPKSVPSSLDTIVLAGEALKPAVVKPWIGRVKVFNAYGPAEASMFAAINGPLLGEEDAPVIGSTMASRLWVTSPLDYNSLVPVGAEGELLIEGPLLAREYSHDAERTAKSFVIDPHFCRTLNLPSGRRMYRTGDLVRQHPETGLLEYLGRLDTQVKIRGQRVEIGEIESHIVRLQSEVQAACVDLVQLDTIPDPILLAAIELFPAVDRGTIVLNDLRFKLLQFLPLYMVPAHFIPMKLPVNASGKLDRQATRAALQALDIHQLKAFAADSSDPIEDRTLTATEEQLRQLWAQVLGLPSSDIAANADFFQLGGDSVSAMRLVAAAQTAPISMQLGVAQILQNPRLVDMARASTNADSTAAALEFEADPAPFELWNGFADAGAEEQKQWLASLAQQCEDLVGAEQIVDVYPATPLQEGLMAITSQQGSAYVAQQVFRMGRNVDVPRLQRAYESLSERLAILRTRLVYTAQGSVQVVTDQVQQCTVITCDLRRYLQQDHHKSFGYGIPLHRLAIVEDETSRYFVWTVHHAAYDGWSLMQLLRMLVQLYQGHENTFTATPISRFIKYLQQTNEDDMAIYWRKQLENAKLTRFPQLPSPTYQPHAACLVRTTLRGSSNTDISIGTLLRAAWAATVATYTGADEAITNIALSGRDAPVDGIANVVGPTITTVPVRIQMTKQQTVSEYLTAVDQQAKEMVPYAHAGLHAIRAAVPGLPTDFDAGHLFIIQPAASDNDSPGIEAIGLEPDTDMTGSGENADFGGYALAVDCTVGPNSVGIDIRFDDQVLPHSRAEALLSQFEHTIHELQSNSCDARMGDLDLFSPADAAVIRRWNENTPPATEACIHELIKDIVDKQPDAPAVNAWDGEYTYGTLHDTARSLAHHLVTRYGVGPEVKVGMCMEKSRWAVVAILAILMAGGAVVPLGIQQPLGRISAILADAPVSTIIVDSTHAKRLEELKREGISPSLTVVDGALLESLPLPRQHAICTTVTPDNAAWVVYTSGSTGVPKGIVLEHKALCSSFAAHGQQVGFGPNIRALQFSAYTFDNAIEDILSLLSYGGCVVVPSESQRLNALPETIQAMQVNLLNCTPTVASLINPKNVPTLKTLLLGGESVFPAVVRQWLGHANIFNTYGPSECSVDVAVGGPVQDPSNSYTIGFPLNVCFWVTSPSDHNRLVPIGTPGELLVEGPHLGRGYLNDPAKTARAFVCDPAFVRHLRISPGRRFYRTGDLVKQNADGSLIHLGRIDTQIKIRGQRVETGDIESNILRIAPQVRVACVDLVRLSDMAGDAMLVAAIDVGDFARDEDESLAPETVRRPTRGLKAMIDNLRTELLFMLPRYMLPHFVPMSSLPLNASSKLDRRAARAILESLNHQQLAAFEESAAAVAKNNDKQSLSPMEKRIRKIWVEVLGCSPNIGPQAHFVQLGGDSVTAMRHAAAAIRVDIRLGVADILQNPRLCDLARIAEKNLHGSTATEQDPQPFELWNGFSGAEPAQQKEWLSEIAEQCDGVATEDIEDVYPATAIQEALMAVTAQEPGAFVAQNVFRLHDVDIVRFKKSWAQLMNSLTILRTRIVYHNVQAGTVQVVVKRYLDWQEADDLQTYMSTDKARPFAYGTPLHRLAIIEDGKYFVWTQHHSGYDGYQTALMLNMLGEVYQGNVPDHSPPPVTRFVKYLQKNDKNEVAAYWQQQLGDVNLTRFPQLPSPSYRPHADGCSRRVVKRSKAQDNAPIATLLRAAWAATVASYTGIAESTSMIALSGRDIVVPDIGSMAVPTLTTVPVRTRLDNRKQRVSDLLDAVARQSEDMKPFLHTGMQHIRAAVPVLGVDYDPGHLFIIQPPLGEEDKDPLCAIGLDEVTNATASFPGYALAVQCSIDSDGTVDVEMRYDSQVMSIGMADSLLAQLEHVLKQLEAHPDAAIGDLDLLNPADVERIKRWNEPVLKATPVQSCMHEMVQPMVERQPNAQAVSAWDGDLTYNALWSTACRLAHHLASLGVGPEIAVGVCMDKSLWAMVSMLAITQAGGVVVALGTQHPLSRVEAILTDARIQVTLVDKAQSERLRGVVPSPVVVGAEFIKQLPAQNTLPASGVMPDNAAWIVYTSGSTGTPKGVVLEHQTICTGIMAHGTRFGNSTSTRALQFASHTFVVFIEDLFTTLIFGGCACIPSEDQRLNMSDLSRMIRDRKVNFVNLTTTAASLLDTREVPGIETIVFGGEALTPAVIEQWAPHAKMMNAYGMSEACAEATISTVRTPKDIANIGFPIAGSAAWVVDLTDYNKLVPVGAPGELLIQGPLLAREYLNDPEKTAASFVSNPDFLSHLGILPEAGARMYRTGDLVQQNDDGSLVYLGRRDAQVKIRGQRVEPGEIESRIAKLHPDISHAFVDLVKPSNAPDSSDAILVAALEFQYGYQVQSNEAGLMIKTIRVALAKEIPPYMVPSFFVPLSSPLPVNASGKLDRKAAVAMLSQMSRSQLGACSAVAKGQHRPLSATEEQLRAAYAEVLGCSEEDIGPYDQFVQLGGDSVGAMRVVAACRRQGMVFSVRDLMLKQSIAGLSSCCGPTNSGHALEELPTSDAVSDVQEWMLNHHVARPDVGMTWFALDAAGPLVDDKMAEACRKLLTTIEILDTGFVVDEIGKWKRVVPAPIKADVRTFETDSTIDEWTEEYIQREGFKPLQQGRPLIDIAICTTATEHRILTHMSHAIYDGICIARFWTTLKDLYEHGQPSKVASYSQYMAQAEKGRTPAASQYWSQLLKDATITSVGNISPQDKEFVWRAGVIGPKRVRIGKNLSTGTTCATALKAAWALTLARQTNHNDVTFADLVSGRADLNPSVTDAFGMCSTPIPVRVQLNPSTTYADLVHAVQKQQLDSMPFETFGFSQIAQNCTDWPAGSKPTSWINHVPKRIASTLEIGGREYTISQPRQEEQKWTFSETRVSWTQDEESFEFTLAYAADKVDESVARNLCDELTRNLEKILTESGSLIEV
ncbi:uncharacterized protein DSM5745_03136 [Aspergillus mulundensis]|uniref:Carrier domain-containing protein n=1 Tax=Aspergillus mulundensis TaxID=1810919 RepID=A0A3D8SJX1_9EURO|nr:hypothetical protein DSM5745_03136 [Aspergillus mulundensis]RDW86494.1 hypothetical protein DSM5745_03136 [Aspergillus mulundensis]